MQKNDFLNFIVLSLAIAIAGISIGLGFYKGKSSDRYVTVKGLAEREFNANLAVWPITFKVTSNDLGSLQQGIEKSREVITAFLLEAGFDESKISHAAPKITDIRANQYNANLTNEFRYIAQSTVTTRTDKVALVKKSMERSGTLVGKGIVLEDENWQNPTEYFYTDLNEIKPQMIEEATKNARLAAEQFAKDSGSKVGKIRSATQGYFSISDRDRNSPDVKIIRVVTTVEYFLAD